MNKYVIACYFYNTDLLKQEIISANSKLEAAISYLRPEETLHSLKELQHYYQNMDYCLVTVIEIDNLGKLFKGFGFGAHAYA